MLFYQYLIDFLPSSARWFCFYSHFLTLLLAQVIKRFVLHAKKTAFVVEHDFIMATYLAGAHLSRSPSLLLPLRDPLLLIRSRHCL